MPFFFCVLFFKGVIEGVFAGMRKAREAKPQPLCADCFFAHVQYGTSGRRAISCTYGGAVRPMKLDVLYCTDYRARNLPLRARAVGFVREIAPVSQSRS
jgi:hypothetical protein